VFEFPKVSFSINLAVFWASGLARVKLNHLFGTADRLNIEHRASNVERPIMMALRLIFFKASEPVQLQKEN
jgi:hypothetical protein